MSSSASADSDMSESTPSVRFSVNWKIPWAEYNGIVSGRSRTIIKSFSTSCNNVSLHWEIMMVLIDNGGQPCFFYTYTDGPVKSFDSMKFSIAVVKTDQSICGEMKSTNQASKLSSRNFYPWEDIIRNALREQPDLRNSGHLFLRIVLEVSVSVFSYRIQNPLSTSTHHPDQPTLVDLFNVIHDPQQHIKMIARDGKIFNCNKTIIGFQSAALNAMLHQPPAEGQAEGEYNFPGFGKDSLHAFLQFLYTAQVNLENLSSIDVIDLANAAKQYNLKPLKEACASVLWNQVVKEPALCFKIIQLSDRHYDLKHLKYRAMDVLSEKSDKMEVHNGDLLIDRFGGEKNGERLRDEFQLFLSRRVEPI